ncbi:lasso peptide biosynthesis B2 protein [Shivajiella indica]|uniref:Lasso peptide biosynthesis B2 protein n=1 Tax=Shivajiella indica TaxID=872115 RepID=A0ABW5B745_9BACT
MIIRKIDTFIKLSKRQKIIFAWIIILSIYRNILFLCRSPKAHAHYFDKIKKIDPRPTDEQKQLALDINKAIRLAVKYIPWKNVCRHQAWQAVYLLNYYNIPYEHQVGFKKDESNKTLGHSWVISCGFFITGECEIQEYKIIQMRKNIIIADN